MSQVYPNPGTAPSLPPQDKSRATQSCREILANYGLPKSAHKPRPDMRMQKNAPAPAF